MSNGKKVIIFLLFIFLAFPIYVIAQKAELSDEVKMCLGCHSNERLTKKLESKEVLNLFVDGDSFANSAHAQFGCASCHTDISMENHPKVKKIKSKKEYSAQASNSCRMCHGDDQLGKQQMHGYMVTKVKNIVCSDCHQPHSMKKIAEWKKEIPEPKYCLTCHRYNFSMTLGSGETLSLYVNDSEIKRSVHKSLVCSVCHTGFSKNQHPVRTFKNRKEYSERATKSCSLCHPDEQLRKNPVHSSLMAKASCVECHGSHGIKSITAQKAEVKENQYCLSCHSTDLTMTFKNGEQLSVYVKEADLIKSAHGALRCIDCHTGFSKVEHPIKTYASKEAYFEIMSEMCKNCHEDAYEKYEGSIHHLALQSGKQAPSCISCHGRAHLVAIVDETLGLTSCDKCHQDMVNSYKESIHEEARMQGKENTPTCSSCHKAHDVESAAIAPIKDSCLNCHKDLARIHSNWLSNPPITLPTFAEMHFEGVECAGCHSLEAERGIYLTLYDRRAGKPLTEADVLKILETDTSGLKEKIDLNGDGIVDPQELWNVFRTLFGKGVWATFEGKIDVKTGEDAHRLGAKSTAVKECVLCHNPESEFFRDVFIVISRADGKPVVYEASQKVIGSIYTILPVSSFYALGSSNVKLLDILFIIALIGGIAVPIGHITLRIITSPLRSLRRMGKGGKK